MTSKKLLLGMLAAALVFNFMLISCDEPKDEWSPVTNISQLDGRWKGSFSYTVSLEDEPIFGSIAEGMEAKIDTTNSVDITINAVAGTASGTITTTMKFTGKDADTVFAIIVAIASMGESNFSLDLIKKTVTVKQTYNDAPLDELAGLTLTDTGVEINQDGKKIRVLIDEEANRYMILKKQ